MIDAHQHFWELERGYYDWLTEDLEALHSDFLPSDLESVLSANQLSGTILVQAAATEAETRFASSWPDPILGSRRSLAGSTLSPKTF